MSKPIIKVENLSKQYRLGAREEAYSTFRESLTGAMKAPFKRLGRNDSTEDDTLWALKDINFEVQPGEVVGIIGRNGAGKSTLLKVLSRITEPTSGRVKLYGRVASLLEVGTGFHPELTGRENIYLNGAILGMARREIEKKFDEIVAFAEVEKFIDTPVKRYSSGMYLRLAFAVAAHLEPEVLVVDEVLAVGDTAFQKKCLGKMGDVAKAGRTVLFVSHNLAAIRTLCLKSIYLDQGQIREIGPSTDIIDKYTKLGLDSTALYWRRSQSELDTMPSQGVKILSVKILNTEEPLLKVEKPLQIAVDFAIEQTSVHVTPGIHLLDREGTIIFSVADWSLSMLEPGNYTSICQIPAFLLNEERINVSAYLLYSDGSSVTRPPLDSVSQTISFDTDASVWIEKTHGKWLRPWPGLIRPEVDWICQRNITGSVTR